MESRYGEKSDDKIMIFVQPQTPKGALSSAIQSPFRVLGLTGETAFLRQLADREGVGRG